MQTPDTHATTLSTKGQVVLPKAIRDNRQWAEGTRLIVEDTADGVLLRRAPSFAPTRPEDVFALLETPAAPKSLDDMDAAILTEARRHACD